MSYRELRNLCEMTRAIGYPRILSLENFRTPNFKLVAELLEWIVKRFDPSATISAEHTETEQDRVLFIKQAVLLLLQNSRLKLNPRKLYQADGYAAQELLPAVKLLYEAGKRTSPEDIHAHWNTIKTKLNAKVQEIRVARQLSSQLPQTGAALHELLGKELYYRGFYQDALVESKQWIEIVHVSHFTTILMEHSSPSCTCDEFTIFSIFVNGAMGFPIILVASSVRNTTSPPKRYYEKSAQRGVAMKNDPRLLQFNMVAILLLRFHTIRRYHMGTLKMQTCTTLHYSVDLWSGYLEG
ncbi:hypothetical protein Y032_0199g1659 [Ancylostoma ceylanicum]|uniref:Uncharacterized protein n=1 Tax=Ancylostoma ceylanicum TaxID=53326 RepID=A0A016SNQ6_9BILA|nr:hypothetical protein Y032_0199g1659 [Ancylostoma ceylanicum]